MKIKDKSSAIKFLKQSILSGGFFNEVDLIDIFSTRYTDSLLSLEFLNDVDFYLEVKKDVENIFMHFNSPNKEILAVALMEKLKNDYCKHSLNETREWFFAAVIHTCFIVTKENDAMFKKAFCMFDINNGQGEAFCRLMIVARTENHCRLAENCVTDAYIKMFMDDGEAVKESRLITPTLKVKMQYLWGDWYPNGDEAKKMMTLYNFLRINNYSKYDIPKSAYWIAIENKKNTLKKAN